MGSEERRRKKDADENLERSQPVIRSSLKRFLYATERSDEGVTGHAGLLVAVEAFHALGLQRACKRELRLKERQRGPSEAEWVELMVMLQLAGGTSLEDLEVFKQDDGLCRLWDLPTKGSPRSALDFLVRFNDPEVPTPAQGKAVIVPETKALQGLGRVNAHLIAEVQRHRPVKEATLDVDASIHPCDKKDALYAYEGGRAYQPVAVYWKEQGLIVYDQFRHGNVPAAMGNLEVVKAALQNLPKEIPKIRVRGDTALYEQGLLRFLDRGKYEFAISADMSPELRTAIEALDEKTWKRLPSREGCAAKEERWWAEVPFVPDDLKAHKGEPPFRYLAIRLPPRLIQLDFFEKPEETKYVAIVTNRWDMPGPDLIHWHREKCGTIEQVHDRLKHDVGARLFPSSKFGANAAWYRLAVIALNLFSALTRLALPEEWHHQRLPTARFRFFNRAGRVLSHARRHLVVLSHVALPLMGTYLAVRQILGVLSG
jgi:hypothetical protein